MEKYGSIEQFKNIVKQVRDRANWNNTTLPTLTFVGTVKLHGTNSSVVFSNDGSHVFQSRERELTLESDNAGFAMWGERNITDLRETYDNVKNSQNVNFEKVVIFGEWCGGSIQKGVALNQLQKMFVVFNITLIDSEGNRTELTPDQISECVKRTNDIKCIYDYKIWVIDIDFNSPEQAQNQLVEWTLEVEDECPFGKDFGVSGIGEGIVWTSFNEDFVLRFKTKGEKHSASKVRTIKEIAQVDIEKMDSIRELVNSAVTENRLKQGLNKLGEMGLEIDIKNTGTFIKWCCQDVLKEEKDTIVESGFDVKEIMPQVSEVAKKFWMNHLKTMGL